MGNLLNLHKYFTIQQAKIKNNYLKISLGIWCEIVLEFKKLYLRAQLNYASCEKD